MFWKVVSTRFPTRYTTSNLDTGKAFKSSLQKGTPHLGGFAHLAGFSSVKLHRRCASGRRYTLVWGIAHLPSQALDLSKHSTLAKSTSKSSIHFLASKYVRPGSNSSTKNWFMFIPLGRSSLNTWGIDHLVHLPMTVHITYISIYIISTQSWGLVVNIPPLIWRDVGESKHHSESFKLFSSKRFGEDVCNFLICGIMTEMDCFGLNMMSNQMIFSIDVLCSIMELWVLGQFYYRGIVNHEWSWLYLFYANIQ